MASRKLKFIGNTAITTAFSTVINALDWDIVYCERRKWRTEVDQLEDLRFAVTVLQNDYGLAFDSVKKNRAYSRIPLRLFRSEGMMNELSEQEIVKEQKSIDALNRRVEIYVNSPNVGSEESEHYKLTDFFPDMPVKKRLAS